jgi:hypothetical protein
MQELHRSEILPRATHLLSREQAPRMQPRNFFLVGSSPLATPKQLWSRPEFDQVETSLTPVSGISLRSHYRKLLTRRPPARKRGRSTPCWPGAVLARCRPT